MSDERKQHSFWRELFLQGIKFGLVGVLNTLISLGIYYLIISFNPRLYLLGNLLGFLVSTFTSYLLNSRLVFQTEKTKKLDRRSLFKTYVTYLSSLGISTLLIYLFVDVWNFSQKIAPLFSLMITVPFNFFVSRYWVYSHKTKHRNPRDFI